MSKNKTILICDDNDDILEVTRLILEGEGYTVYTSSDCRNIVNIVSDINPDLILMDLWIPDEGGEAAIKELRAFDSTSQIPVLIFSAQRGLKEIVTRSGANGFVNKPYTVEELLDTVEEKTQRI